VIQIESIHIQEFRGIRDLTLTMNRSNFVISGPNGSGKSGVVDAIQFALSGEIGRLKGAGTGDLSLSDHGPHVERRSDPEAACVTLTVYIPHLGKSATITRTIKKPKQPKIVPNDEAVKAIIADVAEHPELTLARREIIKFIVTEATQRSRDVQTLLKLDDIDQVRATLKTTENKLNAEHTAAKTQSDSAEESLKRHLDIPVLKSEDLLAAVNKRRTLLGLQQIAELKKETDLSDGLATSQAQETVGQNKESALADVKVLAEAVEKGVESPIKTTVESLLKNIAKVEGDPSLLPMIRRHSFLQAGLDLIYGPQCPLCDAEWEIDKLRSHVQDKLQKSKDAQALRDQIVGFGQTISAEIIRVGGWIEPLKKLPEAQGDIATGLTEWSGALLAFSQSLSSLDGILGAKERLESGWAATPGKLKDDLKAVRERVTARPDKSATIEANAFLVVAQERLNNLRVARRNTEAKKSHAARGKAAYKIYNEVSEAALLTLYQQVEEEFGSYYRLINHDDEGEFKARFEPAEGKLGLLVDFHKKGMFPPAAYHSEGHQDGMGVCLYLALMRRVLDKNFTFAVLDDVVSSVDSQHRKQFCKLLKTKFANTQFIITTHDQVWAKQLRTEGVVNAKTAVAFHTWTVETGPVLDEVAEVWDKIDADLAKNEVPTAAGRLRRHLEFVAADLADELGAKVSFRADGGYDMGELLSAVIGRQGELLKSAAKAAKSWDDAEAIAKVEALRQARQQILSEKEGEQWIINKAIHYNEWADLSKNDFKPVVKAFKELLEQFRCTKPKCDSWLSLTPRNDPVDLRCACGAFRLNLREK
jgi:energy-coupling factor transporter ATP-binding protein EcfA2